MDLQLDKEGKSKGMAVVQYSHPIEAVQAVSMLNDQRLFDRVLTVKMDRYDKDPASDRRDGELPVGLRGVGMGLGANGAPLADVASVISSLATAAPQTHMNGSGGMPAAINPFGPTGQLTGPAAVTNPFGTGISPQIAQQPSIYNPPAQAPFGVAPNPQTVPGYNYGTPPQPVQVPVSMAAPQQSSGSSHFFNPKPAPSVPMGGVASGGMFGGGVKYEPSQDYRGSHQTQQSYSSNGPPSHGYESQGHASSRVILIKNLPMDYTWQIVSDRVQQFGELESVEMISPGVAKVRFVLFTDAERAKATLQGTTVEGRVIGVEFL